MNDWASVLRSLLWVLFWGFLLFRYHSQVTDILGAVGKRIKEGAPFKVGPGGLEVGEVPKLTRALPAQLAVAEKHDKVPDRYRDFIYLVHSIGQLEVDEAGREKREARVYLDADSDEILKNVQRVIYYLHPSMQEPTRVVDDATTHFLLRIPQLPGEFNITADVYFKGYEEPLRLHRYLNFYRSTIIERLLLKYR